ncbi:hypothetical protein ACE6H2_002247 [Prunus campanulata]
MVTTRSRQPSSSSTTPDHSPSRSLSYHSAATPSSVTMPAASWSRLSSLRCSHSISTPRAFYHPPLSHFVSPAHSTRYFNVVFHCSLLIEEDFDISCFGSTFVDFLTRHRLLRLAHSLPLPNFQIVREFYANFPAKPAVFDSLPNIIMSVHGVSIPVNFMFITVALGLVLIRSGTTCEPIPDFLPRH